MPPPLILLLFHAPMVLVVGLALRFLVRRGPWSLFGATVLVFAAIPVFALPATALDDSPGSLPTFEFLGFLAHGIFLEGLVFLVVAAWMGRHRSPRVARLASFAALLLIAAGTWGFGVEPTALEVNYTTIESAKIREPVRIAVLADIQTDRIGEYERRALLAALEPKPDLILFPGDYLHVLDIAKDFDGLAGRLRALFLEVPMSAPLGAFAVRGNTEPEGWEVIFADTGVEVFLETETRQLGELALTGLACKDSFSDELTVAGAPGFHIVMGHAPNFALGSIDADLMIAGHTHGGQVQLPGLGPLLTMSKVPRDWASGRTDLDDGRVLVVSKGIGLERGYAPRVRFLCPPEIVIIDLKPTREP